MIYHNPIRHCIYRMDGEVELTDHHVVPAGSAEYRTAALVVFALREDY